MTDWEFHFSTLTSHQNHLLILTHLLILDCPFRKNKDPEVCQIVSLYNYVKINYDLETNYKTISRKSTIIFVIILGEAIFF